MKLFVKDGRVLAWGDDALAVPASAYGDGVTVVTYAGALSDLDRIGDAVEGGAPDTRPYAAPDGDPVPSSVTATQARIALSRAGKLDAVKAAVSAAGGEVEIWFEYATAWERQNQHVLDLGAGIGLTPAEIDGLFEQAATIAA